MTGTRPIRCQARYRASPTCRSTRDSRPRQPLLPAEAGTRAAGSVIAVLGPPPRERADVATVKRLFRPISDGAGAGDDRPLVGGCRLHAEAVFLRALPGGAK